MLRVGSTERARTGLQILGPRARPPPRCARRPAGECGIVILRPGGASEGPATASHYRRPRATPTALRSSAARKDGRCPRSSTSPMWSRRCDPRPPGRTAAARAAVRVLCGAGVAILGRPEGRPLLGVPLTVVALLTGCDPRPPGRRCDRPALPMSLSASFGRTPARPGRRRDRPRRPVGVRGDGDGPDSGGGSGLSAGTADGMAPAPPGPSVREVWSSVASALSNADTRAFDAAWPSARSCRASASRVTARPP
jgi:hypothetical protein